MELKEIKEADKKINSLQPFSLSLRREETKGFLRPRRQKAFLGKKEKNVDEKEKENGFSGD
jgi:hypothetical protein